MSNNTGAQILDEIDAFLARYISYPSPAARHAHTLWITHTWLMDVWDSTPRIAFLSPEPGSGKSRCLEVTAHLVPRPVHAVNASLPYLFRKVGDPDGRPTILYDEIDTVFGPTTKGNNEDVRGMLNAGHKKTGIAGRCVTRGNNIVTEELPAYCAVALAGLNDLPDTIASRSIQIRMRKRPQDEQEKPWRERRNGAEAEVLRERISAWAMEIAPSIDVLLSDSKFEVDMPAGVTDRNADVWEPLILLADQAGGRWPILARNAAVSFVTTSKDNAPSIGVQLLTDIKVVFDESSMDKMHTSEILKLLNGFELSPWSTIRKGTPLDARGLSNWLKRYEIKPQTIRVEKEVFKGYARCQFEDAWKSYLPASSETTVTSVTTVTPQVTPLKLVTDTEFVTDVTDNQGLAEECSDCPNLLWDEVSALAGKCPDCRQEDASEATGF